MPDIPSGAQIPPQPLTNQKKNNSKKLMIAGTVILVILVGGFLAFGRNTNTEEQASTPVGENGATSPTEEVVIRYSDSGYEPTSMRVSAGTTVTFINESSRPMWTASDVHPTHQILPEFDTREGIAPGERYSHTFTKVGTWKFHDHIKPQHVGDIIVE